MVATESYKINEFGDITYNEKTANIKYCRKIKTGRYSSPQYFIGERVWAYHLSLDTWYWSQIISIEQQNTDTPRYKVVSPAFFIEQKTHRAVYPISNSFSCYGVSTASNIATMSAGTAKTRFIEIPMAYREYSINSA